MAAIEAAELFRPEYPPAGGQRIRLQGRFSWISREGSHASSQPLTQRAYQSIGAQGGNPAVSPDTIYNQAYTDLVQGHLDLAIEGFSAFIRNFPDSDKADDAQYNIGEAYYNQSLMPQAVAAFTRVLNDYPNGDKVTSAIFKRGKAEMAMGEKDNAIEDYKTVLRKYPESPEANLAKAELDNLGVRVAKPTKTAPSKRPR